MSELMTQPQAEQTNNAEQAALRRIKMHDLIGKAAVGEGSVVPIATESTFHVKEVENYSDEGALRTSAGARIDFGQLAYQRDSRTVEASRPEGESTVSAWYTNTAVEGVYVVDEQSGFKMKTVTPEGTEITDKVTILHARDGQHFKPRPVFMRWIDGKQVELTPEDSSKYLHAAKAIVAHSFGLDIVPKEVPRFPQSVDKQAQFDESIMSDVDKMIYELQLEGVTGSKEIRKRLLAELHPDQNPDELAAEKFKYASSLDLEAEAV